MGFAARALLCCTTAALPAIAQHSKQFLDPAHDPDVLIRPAERALTEQFIWTAGDAAAPNPKYQASVRGQNDKIAPHYFRAHFRIDAVPHEAMLYIAGPRSATVFINGKRVLEFPDANEGKGFHVKTADVASALHSGDNVVAVEEVRGHSSLHTGAGPAINQVTYGEVLAVKIVPRGIAEDAAPLLVSDGAWRSSLTAPPDWSAPGFDDSAWKPVQTLGVLGSRKDFLQWNADAGLYDWPGYSGIGSGMRTFSIHPVAVRDTENVPSECSLTGLLHPVSHSSLTLPATAAMSFTLDFGREVSGRLHLVSSSDRALTIETSYGESAEEAVGHAYLGLRPVTVPPHGEAFGPKSAFRYVRLTFPAGVPSSWAKIDVQGIAYPARYLGSFESSDPVLNRIWETGAYTAHLCMQDDIWDAPKRDRGRWMGDLDVSGRVINDVFADRPLMESSLTALIDDSHMPVDRDINTISGYSAAWVTGVADFYRHTGDLEFVRSVRERLESLLRFMDSEVDSDGLFTNSAKHKIFVDWSPGFSADTPEARAATDFEFLIAHKEAAWLLTELGDTGESAHYQAEAEKMQAAAQGALLTPSTNTFGSRWQTNSLAVLSGTATAKQQRAIWSRVLSQVQPAMADSTNSNPQVTITPYFGYYVLGAMARLDHRPEALAWMRQYWGGMLAEGATSFWEAYDPRWPKQDFHAHLQADGKEGYYVSLAHGWSAGPTAWLMREILGIQPTGAGFRTVTIRPDLAGLKYARGAEPTPRGAIQVDATPDQIRISLPPQTTATVLLPFRVGTRILQNGKSIAAASAEDGARSSVRLAAAGEYTFTTSGEPR